jgi:hypothetical protein
MRFEFVPCASLPRLAWCAQLQQGKDFCRVYHGPWLETRGDWFVEGAWTGSFERGELEAARFNLGSGGVLRGGRVVFCAQSDMIERLYSLRLADELLLSNSLVFLLAMADDEPDPRFPFYYHALRAHFMDGIRRKRKAIHTRAGRRVRLHDHCQLAVGPDLRLERIEKPAVPCPESFERYVGLLEGVLAGVLENAASPLRKQLQFEPLATVSGGYDSNALAVLLSRQGVREAITVFDRKPGRDSGEQIAQRLGMSVRVYPRTGFRTAPGVDEAEFCSGQRGVDVVLAPAEPLLAGRVLVIGRYGDVVFGLDPAKRLPDLRTIRDYVTAGGSLLEFRLRVGFLNFNPLYAGGLHLPALHAIGASPAMAPWRLGGDYDRPIARRILEEAGIPRGSFGVRKAASFALHLESAAALSPAGRADFEAYRRTMPRASFWRRQWQQRMVAMRLRGRKSGLPQWLIPVPRRYDRTSEMDFAMHWGHARVRPRYAEAVADRARQARAAT